MVSRWAIVIGIDDYRDEELKLGGAVRDAVRFGHWVTSSDGGGVPSSNCCFLLGRRGHDADRSAPTKDNIVKAINNVVAGAEADGGAEHLYFYFSGHGFTAQLDGREESAMAMPGFVQNPDQSLAVRSLAEHLETTPFDDQFFFIDACRTSLRKRQTIGRWPIPRRRDPGKPPVQQFILYATSPGLTAVEVEFEAVGAFTEVLMEGLAGEERAKAWSWDRNCYEVRWESLANYVNRRMLYKRYSVEFAGDRPPGGWPIQIPQDAGSRGVAGRDRDARLASYPRGLFRDVELTLELKAEPPFDKADVTVLDAIGTPVVLAVEVPRTTITVSLPPRTYAARVETQDRRIGTVRAPIELYDTLTDQIELRSDDGPAEAVPGPGAAAPGTIELLSHDPLSTAEISDESGHMVSMCRSGTSYETSPGFYRVRHLRPERATGDELGVATAPADGEKPQEETFVVLSSGERQKVRLGVQPPDPFVVRLAEALGGRSHEDYIIPYRDAEPMAWAQPSTVLAAGIGGALTRKASLEGLGVGVPSPATPAGSGIALYAVAGAGDPNALSGLSMRMWPTGQGIPPEDERIKLEPSEHAVAGAVVPIADPVPYWLSIERDESTTVLALPVQPNRLAVVIAQVDPAWTRLYQFHPHIDPTESSPSQQLRRVEHLERVLLGGVLDGAQPLADELAATARDDPFAGVLAGYVLLRLGLHDDLDHLTSTIVESAPTLSDAYILRGECEARAGRTDAANQAFADAISAGIPAFGEGLTRLLEGLRTSALLHPRRALVRHIFQQHARGTMWAAFTPTRPLREGRLVISVADLGYEG
jgi:Caspase domain